MINTIKSKKVECIGYVYNGALSSKHWLQFVNGTGIVTAFERDNQLLRNEFLKWSTWADLIVLADKYVWYEKIKDKKCTVSIFCDIKERTNTIS